MLLLGAACAAEAQTLLPRLHVQDTRIVDTHNNTVFLHGVNLGNWLLIEPGGFGGSMGFFRDQFTLFSILRDRFGEAERLRLINLYRDHFITARDFDEVKKFGFNFIRVGFDYSLLEDDAHPMQLRDDAFKYLDFAVAQAKARGIYVLFDLHGAQESQVGGTQAGHVGYVHFWTDAKAQERSLWLWKQIFEHFKGDSTVMGYEPLNEPFDGPHDQLRDFCIRWYKQLREVDEEAVAVFPGVETTLKFYGKPADHGWQNCMFDMHFYPGSFDRSTTTEPATPVKNVRFIQYSLPKWAKTMRDLGTPLLVGEMNVVYKSSGGGEMIRRYFDFCREQNWAISIWTLKEFTPRGGVHNRMWSITTNADPLPRVDVRFASKEQIETAFKNLSTMKLVTDDDTFTALTVKDSPAPLTPTTAPNATEYDPAGAQPK